MLSFVTVFLDSVLHEILGSYSVIPLREYDYLFFKYFTRLALSFLVPYLPVYKMQLFSKNYSGASYTMFYILFFLFFFHRKYFYIHVRKHKQFNNCTIEVSITQWFSTPRNPWITDSLHQSIVRMNILHKTLTLTFQLFNVTKKKKNTFGSI